MTNENPPIVVVEGQFGMRIQPSPIQRVGLRAIRSIDRAFSSNRLEKAVSSHMAHGLRDSFLALCGRTPDPSSTEFYVRSVYFNGDRGDALIARSEVGNPVVVPGTDSGYRFIGTKIGGHEVGLNARIANGDGLQRITVGALSLYRVIFSNPGKGPKELFQLERKESQGQGTESILKVEKETPEHLFLARQLLRMVDSALAVKEAGQGDYNSQTNQLVFRQSSD